MRRRSSSKMIVIGGNSGVYEGAIVRAGAVLGAGVVLTRGTPVYDLVRETIYRSSADRSIEIPEGAVVVSGARRVSSAWGATNGLSIQTPVIVKYRDDKERMPPPRWRHGFVAGVPPAVSASRGRLVVNGELRVPGDKSVSHRAVLFPLLSPKGGRASAGCWTPPTSDRLRPSSRLANEFSCPTRRSRARAGTSLGQHRRGQRWRPRSRELDFGVCVPRPICSSAAIAAPRRGSWRVCRLPVREPIRR